LNRDRGNAGLARETKTANVKRPATPKNCLQASG
jgi:hypothetical protein